jgi:hypothetical protein
VTGMQVIRSHNGDDLDDSASETNGVSMPERRPSRSSDGPERVIARGVFMRLAITVDKQARKALWELFLELTLITQNNILQQSQQSRQLEF